MTKNYIPDFIVTRKDKSKLYLEIKGWYRPEDRTKMLSVKRDNPSLDIRLVFGADNKLNKNSLTRYSDWCDKHGFKYCIGAIPDEWLKA